jgi:hypothetical protein
MGFVAVSRASYSAYEAVRSDIREADVMEWAAGTNMSMDHAFRLTVDQVEHCYMVSRKDDGRSLCFWGVDDLGNGVGNVWLFATNEGARDFKLSLHRIVKQELNKLLQITPILMANSHLANELHHDWLKWLGFKHLWRETCRRGHSWEVFILRKE